jgi:hypothetical protein
MPVAVVVDLKTVKHRVVLAALVAVAQGLEMVELLVLQIPVVAVAVLAGAVILALAALAS